MMASNNTFSRMEVIGTVIAVLLFLILLEGGLNFVSGNTVANNDVVERNAPEANERVELVEANDNSLEARFLAINDNDFVRGGDDADVFVIEYSDLQCPFCARAHGTVQELVSESNGKVSWVYRQLPLSSIHPTALNASKVSICIGNEKGQDAFWEFTDNVFVHNTISIASTDDLVRDASRTSGVSEDTIRNCLVDPEIDERINNDIQAAQILGGNGTPFFVVVNPKSGVSHKLSGALPKENFEQVINLVSQN